MVKKLQINSNNPNFTFNRIFKLYSQLYDLYGDSFVFHVIHMNSFVAREKRIRSDTGVYSFKMKSIEICSSNCTIKIDYKDAFENSYMPVKSKKSFTINFGKNLKVSNNPVKSLSIKLCHVSKISIGKIKKFKEENNFIENL